MRKKHKFVVRKYYKLNQHIQAAEVRLIDSLGKQIGVVSRTEALQRAQDEGVDLVEIAASAKPPVCKIIDFKKFLYQEEKKRREEKKTAAASETKEVRIGPFTSEHDLQVKIDRAKEFLKANNKVKVVVKFAGRQMAHPEFGQKTLAKFLAGIASLAKIERDPHFEGKLYWALVSPEKKGAKDVKKEDKTENKEVSPQTL